MGVLESKLDAMREAFNGKVPAGPRQIMHDTTQALIDSGQADRALGAGASVPAFTAVSSSGSPVDSASLIGRGPLVLTFFRGHW